MSDLKDIQTKPNYSNDLYDRKSYLLKSSIEPISVAISLADLIMKIRSELVLFYKETGLQDIVSKDVNNILDIYKAEVDRIVEFLKEKDDVLQSEISINTSNIINLQIDLKELEDTLLLDIGTIYSFISAITDNKGLDEIKANSLSKLRDAINSINIVINEYKLVIDKHRDLLANINQPIHITFNDIQNDILNIKNRLNELIELANKNTSSIEEINERIDNLEKSPSAITLMSTDKYKKEYKLGTILILKDKNTVAMVATELDETHEIYSIEELISSKYIIVSGVKGLSESNVLSCGTF